MSQFIYFQKYHGKENMHSSNVLYMLKKVYYYNPKIFYSFLAELLECEEGKDWIPQFKTQEKNKKGVTDFSIIQDSFKIVVEAKEKYNKFNYGQIEGHLSSLADFPCANKIFLALSPNQQRNNIFNEFSKKYSNIMIKAITYIDLYKKLLNNVRAQDYELREMIEEFREYCGVEKLIDDTDNTIMVRLAGRTMDFNVKPENNVYYDKATNKYLGFRYLGLYNDKCVKYIGKIQKIVQAYKEKGVINMECLYPAKKEIDEQTKIRVENAIKSQEALYDNAEIPHCYYLVDKFHFIENFRKGTNYALYGKKKFYLTQFGLEPGASVEEIAEKIKNKRWEDFDE